MPLSLKRGASFLFGLGLAFLPAYGPFVGLLLLLKRRFSLKRTDALWLLAALLYSLPQLLRGWDGLVLLLQLMAPWLIYRTFSLAERLDGAKRWQSLLGSGFVAGLALFVVSGLLSKLELNFAYKTLSQSLGWQNIPVVYAHTVLMLGGCVALLLPRTALRLCGLGIATAGIVVSGSREAALAWLFILLGSLLLKEAVARAHRYTELALIALMLTVSAGLGPVLGWGKIGFLFDVVPQVEGVNLIRGSELEGDWWDKTQVSVLSSTQTIDDEPYTVYKVHKKGLDTWLRLQQVIPLVAGETYSVSSWIRAENSFAGIQGWAQVEGEDEPLSLVGYLAGGDWRVTTNGAATLLNSGVLKTAGDWTRVFVTFRYSGESTSYIYLGLAPNAAADYGVAEFAGFQLETGVAPSSYKPGVSTRGLNLSVARVPYWQTALRGVRDAAWLGHSQDFAGYYTQATMRDQLGAVPAHAHNLYLQTLFERGFVGLSGLVLFVALLVVPALKKRDLLLLLLLGAVLFVNFFDITLFSGSVLYPLVAITAWRTATFLPSKTQDASSKQLIVKAALAASDFLSAVLAFASAHVLIARFGAALSLSLPELSTEQYLTIFYALALWPLTSALQDLYPGYGRGASDELRRQVTAALYAGLILLAGTLLFGSSLELSGSLLALTVLISILLAPLSRYAAKRLLAYAGVWGQAVIIFGANRLGEKIAVTLLNRPLDGLVPVGFFDTDATLSAPLRARVPLLGPATAAPGFAAAEGIGYSLVALSGDTASSVETVLRRNGRVFERVRYVPALQNLPLAAAGSLSLSELVSLELRNDLNSITNRFVKRALDVAAVVLGSLLISPLLLVLAALVYLDSPGPVLYGHKRLGRDGKYFKALKFRTMVVNADERLQEYLGQHPEARLEWDASQKLRTDPRVTHLGKTLRKYSLDELPQLWNVLVGQMSLVGPRPIVKAEVPRYGDAIELYKTVSPGITGYWQVNGRSDTDYDERVALDSYYVHHWSLWLDIVILIRTPRAVTRGEGAY